MEPLTWIAVAMLAASMTISVLLAPKAAGPKPGDQNAMNIPQTEDGTPQAVVFGTAWTGDWVVLWTGNFRTSKVKASQAKK